MEKDIYMKKFSDIYNEQQFIFLKDIKFSVLFNKYAITIESYIPKINDNVLFDFDGNIIEIDKNLDIYDFVEYLENDFEKDYSSYCDQKKKEKENLEKERNEFEKVRERNSQKTKKILVVLIPLLCGVAIFFFFAINYFIPNSKYQKATELMQNEDYEGALVIFKDINNFSDSSEKIEELENLIKIEEEYDKAIKLYNDEEYEDALNIFEKIDKYKKSLDYYNECKNELKSLADNAYNNQNFNEALELYKIINEFFDVDGRIKICEEEIVKSNLYYEAIMLFDDMNFSRALEKFNKISEYKDSLSYIEKCNQLIKNYEKWVGSYAGTPSSDNPSSRIFLEKDKDGNYTLKLFVGYSSSSHEEIIVDLVKHEENRIEFHSEDYDVFGTRSFEYLNDNEFMEYYDAPHYGTHTAYKLYKIN